MHYRTVATSCAALVFAVAATSLALRVWLSIDQHGGLFAGIVYLSQFFTILTNLLVAVAMGWIAFRGRGPAATVLGGLTMSIAAVGILYHLLLADLWEPQGWAMIADQGVHTVVPIGMVLWWAAFAPKATLKWFDPVLWLIWPALYTAYAVLRAQYSGFYPYPFLDLATLGPAGFVRSLATILLAFLALGFVLFAISKGLSARRKANSEHRDHQPTNKPVSPRSYLR